MPTARQPWRRAITAHGADIRDDAWVAGITDLFDMLPAEWGPGHGVDVADDATLMTVHLLLGVVTIRACLASFQESGLGCCGSLSGHC